MQKREEYLLKFFKLLPFFIVLLALPAGAQILNVEKSRVDKDSSNYFLGSTSLSLTIYNLNAGEAEPRTYLGFSGNGDLAYFSKKHSYLLIANSNYVILEKEPIVRNGYLHNRVNFMRRRRISYETFAQAQYDLARRLELRMLTGANLRFALIRKKGINLHFGTGLMYEHEEWDSPREGEGIVVMDMIKSNNYLSTRAKFNENFELNSIFYYQVGYDDDIERFRQRLSGDLNLLFKITNRLRFKSSFVCTYENRPIVPVTKFIYTFTNGVQLNF